MRLSCGCTSDAFGYRCEQAYQFADEIRKAREWFDLMRGTDTQETHEAAQRLRRARQQYHQHYQEVEV